LTNFFKFAKIPTKTFYNIISLRIRTT